MKLTWFGGTTIRIHAGGTVLVADASHVPEPTDRTELLSGVDIGFSLITPDSTLPEIDPAQWRARRPARLIDATPDPLRVSRIGPACVLIDAPGEPPVTLIAGEEAPRFGRWADDGVIVLLGDGETMSALGEVLLDIARPRLIALAGSEQATEFAFERLREHIDGTVLTVLEPRLALEA